MSKQTAIEWFIEQIEEGKIEIVYSDKVHTIKCLNFVVEQAKAMERKQHGDTWDAAIKAYRDRGNNVVRAIVDFDEYWANKSKTPPGKQ